VDRIISISSRCSVLGNHTKDTYDAKSPAMVTANMHALYGMATVR